MRIWTKNLNWKLAFGLVFLLKFIDIFVTYLCLKKTGDYGIESNFLFRFFYENFGLDYLWALFLSNIFLLTPIAILFKIINDAKEKHPRIPVATLLIIVMMFVVLVNNAIVHLSIYNLIR
jgi:hypothetical protein